MTLKNFPKKTSGFFSNSHNIFYVSLRKAICVAHVINTDYKKLENFITYIQLSHLFTATTRYQNVEDAKICF